MYMYLCNIRIFSEVATYYNIHHCKGKVGCLKIKCIGISLLLIVWAILMFPRHDSIPTVVIPVGQSLD